jgi:hypothetical protein
VHAEPAALVRRLERPAGAALWHAYEGRTAALDGKSYFGARQKYIIKLSLFRLLTLDFEMSHRYRKTFDTVFPG